MPRSLSRRTIIGTAGALVAALGVVLPAHADVVDPNMLQVSDGVTFESCNDVPFSLKPLSDWGSGQSHALGNVFGTYNYAVKLTVIAPDGTEGTERTVNRSADDLKHIGEDTGEFFLCDGAGTYVVQASGYWCWVNYKPEAAPDKCQTVDFQKSFALRAAKTVTTLKPAAKSYRISKKPLTFTATVSIERSTGTFASGDTEVRLQYLKGSRWVTYRTAYSKSAGTAKFKVKFADTGRYKFRATVAADDDHSGSQSSIVKLRVTR